TVGPSNIATVARREASWPRSLESSHPHRNPALAAFGSSLRPLRLETIRLSVNLLHPRGVPLFLTVKVMLALCTGRLAATLFTVWRSNDYLCENQCVGCVLHGAGSRAVHTARRTSG